MLCEAPSRVFRYADVKAHIQANDSRQASPAEPQRNIKRGTLGLHVDEGSSLVPGPSSKNLSECLADRICM